MKTIKADLIVQAVKRLCIEANCALNPDGEEALSKALAAEESEIGKNILQSLIQNAELARQQQCPICQDTGMAVVFAEVGSDLRIEGGFIGDLINQGVREGYRDGFLRKSVVEGIHERKNTGDNTPAIIHYELVKGDNLKLTVAPKGFGSENMSRIFMLSPSQGIEAAKELILSAIVEAGGNPCPPILVGIGLGGDFEKCAIMAKKALLRPIGQASPESSLQQLEEELLGKINQTGIGPMGLGGRITALAVHAESFPTHIAGFPVAMNVCCHVVRHKSVIL